MAAVVTFSVPLRELEGLMGFYDGHDPRPMIGLNGGDQVFVRKGDDVQLICGGGALTIQLNSTPYDLHYMSRDGGDTSMRWALTRVYLIVTAKGAFA